MLARSVLAVRNRSAYLAERFPLLVDAAFALVLLVLALPPLTGLRGSDHPLSVVLIIAIVAPLTLRRREPFLTCVAITVLAVVAWFTTRELTAYLAVLVAFYTVAAYAPMRRVFVAAVLVEAGATAAAANWPGPSVRAAWAWLIASTLIAASGFYGYYIRAARQARLATQAERAEQLARDQQQQAQLAVAAERSRIARELHDIVAHNIAMMIALSDGAAATAAKTPDQAVALMGEISTAGRAALTEMRRLLGVLRQPSSSGHSPQPSLADIDDLLAGVRSAGLPTRLTVTGQPFGVPASAQLALYRMVQEALTNSIRHAAGSSAVVQLSYRPGEVELEVTDDGQRDSGSLADDRPMVSGGGHGIVGMRERAAVFGGQVTAGPRPGRGWRVHTVLHLGSEPAASGADINEDSA